MTRPDQEDRDRTMGEASLEERLQESENRLRELQRIANLGSWDWNITTNELWWSDQIYLIFGMDPGAFAATYEAFLSRVHPDDLGRVQLAVNQVLEAGGAYDASVATSLMTEPEDPFACSGRCRTSPNAIWRKMPCGYRKAGLRRSSKPRRRRSS